MAGNKADLAASRAVDYEEAKQYADENGLLFMETSAKTAVNVNEIFLAIGNEFVRNFCCMSQVQIDTAMKCIDFIINKSSINSKLQFLFARLAKKLPKNEGTGQQQNIRPNGNETNRPTQNCCSK